MKLDIGRVDYMSMEVVDMLSRPFRFKHPETLEFKNLREKLPKKEFNKRAANSLKTFKLDITSLDHTSVSRLARKIERLSEFSLDKLIKERVFYFNEMIEKIYRKINFKVKNNVIEDVLVSRDYWVPFLTYTVIFQFLYGSIYKLEFLGVFPQFAGLIYRLVSFASFEVLNKSMKKSKFFRYHFQGKYDGKFLVHNLWSKMGLEETIAPYIPFIETEKFQQFFSTYEINELGGRSYFTQMDRNKVLFDYLKSAIDIAQLREDELINSYFFIHDRFMKDSKSNIELFEDVIEDMSEELDSTKAKNKGLDKIKKFMLEMQDFGEGSDFLEQSLNEDMAYECCNPMEMEIAPIRDYFGEKIALMFLFISYYGKKKYFIIWVTTAIYIAVTFTPAKDTVYYKYLQFAQMILINIYSLNFYQKWAEQEKLFSMKFGQEALEEEDESRINFDGYYMRDLASNEMNEPTSNFGVSFRRRLLIYLINLGLLVISVATSSLVIILKKIISEGIAKATGIQTSITDKTVISTSSQMVFYMLVVMNAMIVELLNVLYDKIYVRMTDYENHSNLSIYETSLLIKRFFFKLFNMFNSMVIIALFKAGWPLIFGKCNSYGTIIRGGTHCFTELRFQGSLRFLKLY